MMLAYIVDIFTMLNDLNLLILEDNHRQMLRRKRAPFRFMNTYFYKPLFGFMDEEDAKLIANKINEMINRTETHTLIIGEELSLIQQTLKLTNMSLTNIKICHINC